MLRATCISLLFLILSGCKTLSSPMNIPATEVDWQYADLRIVDEIDAQDAENDLLAVYTRQCKSAIQIRVDFLQMGGKPAGDLYIAGYSGAMSGGKNDALQSVSPFEFEQLPVWIISIPEFSPAQFLDIQNSAQSNVDITYEWDASLRSIIIDLNKGSQTISKDAPIQVILTKAGSNQILDKTIISQAHGQLPPQAPLILEFWNTLPADSPAIALRRWDGAHTGPLGGRHGLSRLLAASSNNKIPIILLDLKNQRSLAALNYLGQLDWLRQLEEDGLLILPECGVGSPSAVRISLAGSNRSAHIFGFRDSNIAFGSFTDEIPGYRGYFAAMEDQKHIYSKKDYRLIPLSGSIFSSETIDKTPAMEELDSNGLTDKAITALITAATSQDPADLVVFGGSLPDSVWGNPNIANKAFEYIHNHPWIKVLKANDLLTYPAIAITDSFSTACSDLICTPESIVDGYFGNQGQYLAKPFEIRLDGMFDDLVSLPATPLTEAAWSSYQILSRPTNNLQYQQLQANSLNQLKDLITLAKWVSHPDRMNECQSIDGVRSCFLASTSALAIVNQAGGCLTHFVSLTSDGPVLWIAPTSQFSLGLSDPKDWLFALGTASDPTVIPGAFIDDLYGLDLYQITFKDQNSISAISPDGKIIKTYSLNEHALRVQYESNQEIATSIPVANWRSDNNKPGWYNRYLTTQIKDNLYVQDSVSMFFYGTSFKVSGFFDSYDWITSPEDPNRAYPAGHYLPFPMQIIFLTAKGDFFVDITIK